MNPRINDIEEQTTIRTSSYEYMTTGSMDDVFLSQLNEVIDDNLGNEQFTVEELADAVAYSRSQLHRKIQKLTNQSISQYVRNRRLERGMSLLETNAGTVSEIAYKVGFSSSTYFIKCFSERYGVSPGEVRRIVAVNESIKPPKDEKERFEALHPGASEGLIRELYEHLILFKPELETYFRQNENEDASVDVRFLAFEIIRSYPWPLAVELRRLFSGAMKDVSYKRLVQLKRALSRILDFFTYLLLSELIDELSKNDLRQSLKEACKACLKAINLKNQAALFRESQPLMENQVIVKFVKELDALFDKAFFRELEQWEKMEPTITDMEVKEACSILEQTLIFFIKKAAFLARYQLINVSSIKVNKLRFRSPMFRHELHLLNSVDSNFSVREELLEQFSDSNAVLLVKKIDEPSVFINLSPFVIDTHSEVNKDVRKRVKRDVYLFKRSDGEKLHYVGSEVMTTTDLEGMDHYELLEEEYRDICQILDR